MAKTETNVNTLKINRGTYAKVQENLSSITENELIITSDKNVPIPTTNDNGKAVVVNASGEYELGNAGTNVVANPTLAGTETALSGLQVGDTKYKVDSGMTNPMTTAGDIIYGGADGTPTRLAGGTLHQVLKYGSSSPIWSTLDYGSLSCPASSQYKSPYIGSAGGGISSTLFGKPAKDFGLGTITTAPTADNTDGLKIVVLTSEPATYYNGYYYIIAPST